MDSGPIMQVNRLLCHVPHWFSPFSLPEVVVAQLKQAGLAPVTVLPVEQGKPVLLLYDTPDRLLSITDLDGSALLDGYRALLSAPVSSPRLTLWRLATLDAAQLDRIFSGNPPPEQFGELLPPEPEPLAALVTGVLCRSVPGLLDAYLDLELQALLGGGAPDSAYLKRLQSRLSSDELLQAWRSPRALAQQAAELRKQLGQSKGLLEHKQNALAEANQKLEQHDIAIKEVREEAELTQLQLQQVQEYYLQKSRSSDQQVAAQAEALQRAEVTSQAQGAKLLAMEAAADQLRRERDEAFHGRDLQGKNVVDLQQQLSNKTEALTKARAEAERTQLQLQQVQEELEHYFLHSRSSDQLVAAQAEQNGRAFSLLGRMLQLTTASGAWLPDIQPPPLSSRSKRSRLRWGR